MSAREEFEKSGRENGYDLARLENGNYSNRAVNGCWIFFKRGSKEGLEAAAKVCDNLSEGNSAWQAAAYIRKLKEGA